LNLIDGFESVKFTNRIKINGIIYTDKTNKSKFNDSCIQTKSGDFGFIHKIVVTNENKVFFILKRVVKLLDCFFNEHFEKYKSKTFLCSISDEFFISKIDSIKKCSFIRIDRELNFIITFNMKHLYH
jgi:hypothetical protein